MADDLPTLSPGDRDPARHNTVTRQAVQRILEVQATANGAAQVPVVNADLADMADATVKGRAAGAGAGAPVDLTATQLLAVLNTLSVALISGTWTFDANSSGAEGGEIHLTKPPSGSSLAGDVAIDLNTNSFRVFENGGGARGFNVDLTGCADGASTKLLTTGLETIWMPAGGMIATATIPPSAGTYNPGNGIIFPTFDFDQTTVEAVTFTITMPKSWDKGGIYYQPYWTASAGSGGVVWGVQSIAVSNGDTLNFSYTTSVSTADTLIATDDLHVAPLTGAFTPDGSPANDDLLVIAIFRAPADASDTLTADARLIGVKMLYTVSAGNDT